MRMAVAATDLRALMISAIATLSEPWPSSASIMRRDRAPIDDRTASVSAAGA